MFKKFASRLREYKRDMIISVIFMIFAVTLEVFIPFIMSYMIDFGISPGNMNMILLIGGILVVCALASLGVGIVAARASAVASAGFAKNLREDIYGQITDFSFHNLDKFPTASLITRLTTDVASMQNVFQFLVRISSRSPLMLVFSLIMTFVINPRLALIFVCVLPVLGLLVYLVISHAFPIFRKALATYDKLNNVVSENLKGIRVVKSYVREDFEEKKFEKVSTEMFSLFSSAEKILAFFNPSVQFAIYICMLCIAWFGAHLIVADSMTIGQLTSFIIYINQILFALIMLSMLFIQITMSRASAERIIEVLEENIDLVNPADGVKEINSGDISFEHVSFGYSMGDDKFVLRDINLEIKAGQTIGILGGTGSSKSSLVQLIPRLYDTTHGSVKVGGVDVKKLDLVQLREDVSMVLQKNILFSGSIIENLKWADPNATLEEMIEYSKIACAHDFIDAMPDKYETKLEQGATNLSGGQRQRLCIARALLKKPKIIIFDDTTSALDGSTEAKVLHGLQTKLAGTTKIIISQRISSVINADNIILMDDRHIQAMGTHEQLLADNAIYQEIYESQVKEDI